MLRKLINVFAAHSTDFRMRYEVKSKKPAEIKGSSWFENQIGLMKKKLSSDIDIKWKLTSISKYV